MWIYPVDMKRTNEFGQTFEKEKVDEKEEVDQPTTSKDDESNTSTSKAKKRLVKSK